jgi:hypothetical protein
VRARIRQAWALSSHQQALSHLRALAAELERVKAIEVV